MIPVNRGDVLSVFTKPHTSIAFTRPKAGRTVGPLNWTQKHKKTFETVPHRRLRATPPGPRAIGPCRCRTTGQHLGELANSNGRPLRTPACVARGDFLEVSNFAPLSEFLHINGRNFLDFFIRSRLPMTPVNDEKFCGNRSARS